MRYIVCEHCRKRYNYKKDEFCPRCGAFNQPVKTWGMDASGNVIRVDGINERDHAGSFVHSEVHHEKDARRAERLDWQTSKPTAPPRMAAELPGPVQRSTAFQEQPQRREPLVMVLIVFGIIFSASLLLPLLVMLLD